MGNEIAKIKERLPGMTIAKKVDVAKILPDILSAMRKAGAQYEKVFDGACLYLDLVSDLGASFPLRDTPAGPGRGKKKNSSQVATSLIPRYQASRWRRVHQVPAEVKERHKAECREAAKKEDGVGQKYPCPHGLLALEEKVEREKRLAVALEALAEQYKTGEATAPQCLKADACEFLRAVEPLDLLLTDPPYMTDVEDIQAFAGSWLPLALEKLKPTGRAYVFIGAYPEEVQAYLSVAMPNQILVWTYRNTLGPQPKHDYIRNLQFILYYRKPKSPPLHSPMLLEQISVHDFNHPARSTERLYEFQKPDELAERFIRHATRPGELVVDPFCGCGTFLVAAGKLNRRSMGCDVKEEALQLAKKRGCTYESGS